MDLRGVPYMNNAHRIAWTLLYPCQQWRQWTAATHLGYNMTSLEFLREISKTWNPKQISPDMNELHNTSLFRADYTRLLHFIYKIAFSQRSRTPKKKIKQRFHTIGSILRGSSRTKPFSPPTSRWKIKTAIANRRWQAKAFERSHSETKCAVSFAAGWLAS